MAIQPVRLTAHARDLADKAKEHLAEADAADSETVRRAHLHAAAEMLGGIGVLLAQLGVSVVCRGSAP